MTRWVQPERRAHLGLGYCPEGRRVFAGLTVQENLEVAVLGSARGRATLVDALGTRAAELRALVASRS